MTAVEAIQKGYMIECDKVEQRTDLYWNLLANDYPVVGELCGHRFQAFLTVGWDRKGERITAYSVTNKSAAIVSYTELDGPWTKPVSEPLWEFSASEIEELYQ